ncbi:MAG TPA: AAA family ATPase, partial [Thermomicrobiales bacterium]|nr:AAA family ATPase [Thermomicrobiales bacterium]
MAASEPADGVQRMTASIVPLEPRRRESLPELPVPLNPIVGRDGELAEARAVLLDSGVHLLTLTGPGGVGKTRFALALAHDLRPEFSAGAAFVSLASSTSPEMVLPAIARGLFLRDEGDRPLRERLFAYLRTRQMLLVLDNFEHVVEAAPLVSDLLTACPDLKVLATTSTVLRVQGEHEFSLRPLGLPQGELPTDLDALSRVDAVALFVQRARTVRPDFTLTGTNAPIIAEICRMLDGLPLAIELAAARSKVLSPSDLLARLDDRRFQVLVSNSRDVPERQQTMRNAIEWGYNLLDADEQALFRTLSVFGGGWTLPAAEAVLAHTGTDVLDGLASLTDKSLVRQREDSEGELRFWMLETIREYGLERLVECGDEDAVRGAHARYFEQMSVEAVDALTGPDSNAWMDRLEREHTNIRLALEWVVASGEGARGMAFGAGLWRFWETRGYLNEGRRWMDRLFSLAGAEAPSANRVVALFGYGRFTYNHCEYETAEKLFNESYAIASDIGDTSYVAGALMQLGHVALVQGDYATARERYDKGLAIRRA